jgi:6-phosphogluconolactonase
MPSMKRILSTSSCTITLVALALAGSSSSALADRFHHRQVVHPNSNHHSNRHSSPNHHSNPDPNRQANHHSNHNPHPNPNHNHNPQPNPNPNHNHNPQPNPNPNPAPAPVVGYAYVNDNTTGVNTLAGFERHADGSLTPLPGSPFSIGGEGSGKGLGSQGALQLSGDGRYALAVDAASNQISVLALGPGGVPRAVGAPVSSGGVDPVSIAVAGDLVYVANAGAGDTDVTGFILDSRGDLDPLPGSTVALPEGSGPADVLLNATAQKLVVTLVDTSTIESFNVRGDGRLLAAPGSPFAAQGLGPFGSEFSPTNPSQLFVSNAHNGTGLGTVSAYDVSFAGELSPIGGSPFPDAQTAPCWLTISRNGQYLFAVNTGSGFISSYAISPSGTLTLLGSVSAGPAGTGAVDARLSPDGRTLLVNGSKANVVMSFAVNGGELTQLASSPTPLPAGALASGIVVD